MKTNMHFCILEIHFLRKPVFVLLFFIFSKCIFAQADYPFIPLQQQPYFTAFCTLDSLKTAYKDHKYENEYWQALGTLYSFVGKYERAKSCFLHRDTILNNVQEEAFIDLKGKRNRIEELDHIYQDRPIILFNEAHHVPLHRAFLYSQLAKLRAAGYSYLAIEALNNDAWEDSLLQTRRYPLYLKTGIYINDPIFAHLIRKAIDLGFTLIPYDSYTKNREEEQAKNILATYNEKKGGLVVLGGYAHICKLAEKQMMGYFLSKYSTIPVVSITQYQLANYKHTEVKEVFLQKNAIEEYDYSLFFPKTIYDKNIPSWFSMLGFSSKPLTDFYRKKLIVPSLIQVCYPNESGGIPVYQLLVENENEIETILVPFLARGEYQLRIENKVYTDSIKVKF